ncbi:hypothetical protein GHA01_01210 [Novacetimonas hansenii]|uniref:Uncharacterized protein n=1 Tax=Novacetimonas hansenii TaxID=436 RepID=A0ABQ0SAM7_NOVHA|nr:hypothetical protein Gaha_0042_010 [Novacetimonas hansenii JCM 7643]GBQ56181.1 hypothetical protein AA0243_1121 [Novacetimonas hansenii NRIC 0243]GEC62272.1 hypothetical protein GHA01_01210 [Novacetimonas hansenii]
MVSRRDSNASSLLAKRSSPPFDLSGRGNTTKGAACLGKRFGGHRRHRRYGRFVRHTVKEKRNRHIQNPRQVIQARRTNTIGATFIFLHLLKCQPQRRSQTLLRHAKQRAA